MRLTRNHRRDRDYYKVSVRSLNIQNTVKAHALASTLNSPQQQKDNKHVQSLRSLGRYLSFFMLYGRFTRVKKYCVWRTPQGIYPSKTNFKSNITPLPQKVLHQGSSQGEPPTLVDGGWGEVRNRSHCLAFTFWQRQFRVASRQNDLRHRPQVLPPHNSWAEAKGEFPPNFTSTPTHFGFWLYSILFSFNIQPGEATTEGET